MGKKGTKTQFKRRTFHVPNLIAIWVDPIDKSPMVDSYVKRNWSDLIHFQEVLSLQRLPVKINYSNFCIRFGT